jgi:hypothetical protein
VARGQELVQALVRKEDEVLSFHEFISSILVAQPDVLEATGWTCPLLCYFAAVALRDDGSLIGPETFSGQLAKFKYLVHATGIVDADLKKANHPRGMIG